MSTPLFCQTCRAALPGQATRCAACGSLVIASTESGTASPAVPVPCSLPKGFVLAGRYRILQSIGQGGFATVYKAQDRTRRNRLIAIKQIHLEALSSQERLDATNAYHRETTHLLALRHRSLPRIYTSFMDNQHWYIIMEYLAGKTLEESFQSTRRGFLPVKRVLDIGLGLCDAFFYLHMQSPPIIFRDMKPANIIITRSGRICLIDFGIARPYRPGWKDTSPLGTPGYAAPEQYGRHARTTPQTDIYGLGATLQTLLTGKEPLEILQDGIPSERAGAIPKDLQDLLARMLERDARQRPRDMSEVKQALQMIKEQRPGYKIKAACTFLWELRKENTTFSGLFLVLLACLDFLSLAGLTWPLIGPLSLLFITVFTIVRSFFVLRQAREDYLNRLPASEILTLIWKQLTCSIPFAFGFSLFLSCLFQTKRNISYDPLPDLIALGIIAGGSVIASLIWLVWWLFHLRASQRVVQQQQPQKLEDFLVQTVRKSKVNH